MISHYKYWTDKLGPFPFSHSPLKSLLTYVDGLSVIVTEGEKQEGDKLSKEDMNGRGIVISKNGHIWIGCWKNGKLDGLMRHIKDNGSE
jgi:hypothetical protein